MPLPDKDSITFRGMPSLDAPKQIAVSLTLTQKQVEAIFARQAQLQEDGSAQSPLEIDFENNQILIGSMVTPYIVNPEDGSREICRRAPTMSKPLAGIALQGHAVGKFTLRRDFDQGVADSVRRATEAENSKRSERTIVRLDELPAVTNGKKSKSSTVSTLAKKAMSNNRAQRPVAVSQSDSRPSTPSGASSSRSVSAPSSVSNLKPAPDEPLIQVDLTSHRSRATHRLALEAMTATQFQTMLSEITRRNVDGAYQTVLNDIGEVIPEPKSSTGPPRYQLKNAIWREVRPKDCPDLTPEQRITLARKGRLTISKMGYDSTHALWACFQTTDTTDKGEGSKKGGVFLATQKGSSAKAAKTAAGIPRKSNVPAKSKAPKEVKPQDDFVESKGNRTVSNTLDKGKIKDPISIPGASSSSQSVKREEPKASSSLNKPRASTGTVKKEPSPLPPRPSLPGPEPIRKKKTREKEENSSGTEEGELTTKSEVKKRKAIPSVDARRPPEPSSSKIGDNRSISSREEKERQRARNREEEPTIKPGKEGRQSLSSSKGVSSSKDVKPKKESRDSDFEMPKERGRERERERDRESKASKKRRTPSWSSSDGEADEPPKKKTALNSRSASSSTTAAPGRVTSSSTAVAAAPPTKVSSSKPITNGTKASRHSYILADDKAALKQQYNELYPRYIDLNKRLHAQYTKVESSLLTADSDTTSTDGDADMLDDDEIKRLCTEHERLKDFLGKIRTAHAKASRGY
ncbi:hypothetical protein M422DRAFT_777427 [Sphaerobolus stellatus SS14]|nr:hypothetical protein M422DRAFT_777427 [Sphaerobolus stellatus SS14]